jgi:hypothetical protein
LTSDAPTAPVFLRGSTCICTIRAKARGSSVRIEIEQLRELAGCLADLDIGQAIATTSDDDMIGERDHIVDLSLQSIDKETGFNPLRMHSQALICSPLDHEAEFPSTELCQD